MRTARRQAWHGFALIDALVALVIVGIMTVGLSNAWLQFQRTTQLTQMRQTAHALLDDLAQNLLVHDARFGTASRITLTTGSLPSGDALQGSLVATRPAMQANFPMPPCKHGRTPCTARCRWQP